jgi:Spy/CpxP family protein refolding chaperone
LPGDGAWHPLCNLLRQAAIAAEGEDDMKKYAKSLALFGLLGATSLAAFALADPPAGSQTGAAVERGGPRGMMKPSLADRLSRHSQELGLTPQQLESIKAAEQAARPELERLAQALHQRNAELRKQIDGILTAEQRTKLQELRGKMGGHRRHHGPPTQGDTPAK